MLILQLAVCCLSYIFVLSMIIFLDRNIETVLKVLFNFSIDYKITLYTIGSMPGYETLTQKSYHILTLLYSRQI